MALTDGQIAALLPRLEEAARASQRTVDRFVEPKTGISAQVASRRHHFVLGRRGVGKSTLLRYLESEYKTSKNPVAFVDLETLRGITYPDVLIQLLLHLTEAVAPSRLGSMRTLAPRLKARRRLARIRVDLQKALRDPDTVEHELQRRRRSGQAASGGLQGRVTAGSLELGARGEAARESSTEAAETARFEKTKMDVLSSAATEIRRCFEVVMRNHDQGGFIILDDFYHVSRSDQPRVLGYLQQVTKNLDIYLKVGAVKHRLNPFVEGDPPTGLQVGHDAGEIDLDVTLENFPAAKRFLESVLREIIEDLDFTLEELLTDQARDRLVLAAGGGVARDYLYLLALAARHCNEREDATYRPRNRVTAEDVNEVSGALLEQKQTELGLDAGASSAELRERLKSLVSFCLDVNDTNVFLVESVELVEQEWGRQVEALADLRLVHKIAQLSVQNARYRGSKFTAFTLDLSSYTGTRAERIKQVPFWTTEGRKQLRRPGLIYRGDALAEPDVSAVPPSEPVNWEQEPLPIEEPPSEAFDGTVPDAEG